MNSVPRILIAEDDPASQYILRYMLDAEYALTLVADGISAIEALLADPFDLVLLDIGLPRANGLEVLAHLRAQPMQLPPPVIIISAFNDRDIVIQALHLGANDYVTKPFDLEVLRARIEMQIGLQRFAAEQQSAIEALIVTRDTQQKLCRVISHDIKSPLTNFRIGHYMLRELASESREVVRVLDNMELTLISVVDMVQVFVDAIESQQLRPHFALVEVERLARDVIGQHQLIGERKAIVLSSSIPSATLWGDARLLNQALSNLVNNALKFSTFQTEVRLHGEMRGDRYRFSVIDQGPGIPPAERDSLFGMFVKLRNRPTGGESSSGLGLWIVRQLIELHHGSYGVDAAPGGGSIFWIEVGCATPEQIAAPFTPLDVLETGQTW